MTKQWILVAGLAVVWGTACGDGSDKLTEVPTDECASGLKWTGLDFGSEYMHPGGDCIGCHSSRPFTPTFTAAGTVYDDLDAAEDCAGTSGATVEITGADGKVLSLTTNAAGNFHTSEPIALPYKIRVLRGDQENVMQTPQSTGACNSCHTQAGKNGAPGRVLAPPPAQ